MTRRPFVLDCDTGRDDALAIWVAAGLNLPLTAVLSSYGNTPLENAIENTRRVLGLAAAGCPLFQGLAAPAKDHRGYRETVLPRQEKSGNGLCNINLPQTDHPVSGTLDSFARWIEERYSRENPVDYIITGPATNLAALLRRPGFAERLGHVTMMGGKFPPLWETLPGADFNCLCDPFAVNDLLRAGLSLRFVPMNATWPIAMTVDEIVALAPQTALARAAQEIMIAHCRRFAPEPVFRFHDPAALLACRYEDNFEFGTFTVTLDEQSSDFGRIMPDDKGCAAAVFRASEKESSELRARIIGWLGFDTVESLSAH